MNNGIDFEKCFEALTGHAPFGWQVKLYQRFLADDRPSACDIPTGLGKTSVMAIWLLALAARLSQNAAQASIPRRLVYVVDRRVIVDQATAEAEKLLKNLSTHEDLREVSQALRNVAFLDTDDQDVVALSTLRGEFADNRKWLLDPSRPAIIVGTVDMIGSRLLFSAYGGVGASYKALQAGLLGQDALIVIDEAHLSPVFLATLEKIRQAVYQKPLIKPFAVMSLSATHQNNDEEPTDGSQTNKVFSLENDAPEDLTHPRTEPRLNAPKNVSWHNFEVSEETLKSKKAPELIRAAQAQKMVEIAAQYQDKPVSVLLFGQTVELVKEIKRQLLAATGLDESQVLLMVGGMRGFERDALVKNPVFEMFAPRRREKGTQDKAYFLIATSCAEVGVDLDADAAVCDLAAADSFVQRMGRVNRLGKTVSEVAVVYPSSLTARPEAVATFHKLREINDGQGFNATPLALRALEFDASCKAAQPLCPPLDKARLDDWSMTSLKQDEFPRPLVAYWLRGVTENTSAETALCWRADLTLAESVPNKIATVETVRVKSRECARESTSRAVKTILSLAADEERAKQKVVVISAGNRYEVQDLAALKAIEEKTPGDLYKELAFATVVLPCAVGGLVEGIAVEVTGQTVAAVPDVVDPNEWLRVLLTETSEGVTAKTIGGDETFYEGQTTKEVVKKIAAHTDKRGIKQIKLSKNQPSEDDAATPASKSVLAYFISRKSPERFLPSEANTNDEKASTGADEILLEAHNADVGRFARSLAAKLALDKDLADVLELAGEWHDKGKNRACWQKAVGNNSFPAQVLAKSAQTWFGHNYNQYYRHEFGSLVEASAADALQEHPYRDLILHLIATHHGYARPHFPARAFDRDNPTPLSQKLAAEAMHRFAQLQIKYGWWQLAYLEAVLKAADALASRAALSK